VSSGGGHWVELLRLRPAFAGADVAYVTVSREYQRDVASEGAGSSRRGGETGPARFYTVNDATRWNKLAAVLQAARILLVLVRERPDVVITTGAAPGYFALRLGRRLGARTIWIDSIANVEELSLSGQMAGRFADLWLTQWPHLAKSPGGPHYAGAVL